MTEAEAKSRVFRDWEEAAKGSKFGKAVGSITIEHKDKRMRADIVKPLNGDGTIYWEGVAIPIRRATSREVDSCRTWRAF